MIQAFRRPSERLLAVLAAAVVSGCASSLPQVDPADIPRLEQEAAARPSDTDLQVRLGMARFQAGEYEAARTTLRGAVDAGNESGAAYLYLGMVQEELQDWSAARAAYTRYLEVGASSEGREEVRRRLTMIGRNLLRAQAAQALAQEAEITATGSITPQSVAVMPLAFNSDREDLEPLIYALSDMMITDFKVSNALVVLERAQVQALLDEMALTSSGYSDRQTGARAGRMLRAEHVVQGVLTTLDADQLQTDADILNVPSGGSAGELTESAVLEQLFDMEKQIVIRTIREVLGVTLTPAEEQAILENRMQNVLAFVAYGRGLRLLDQGNYAEAQAQFDQAAALEPGSFQGLQMASLEASAMLDAATTSTSDLATIAGSTGEFATGFLAPPLATTTQSLTTVGVPDPAPVGAGSSPSTDPGAVPAPTNRNTFKTLTNVAEGVNPTPTALTLGLSSSDLVENPTTEQTQPSNRDPVQEVSGSESVDGTLDAQIRIVIQRPGGEQ
jgi:tetratricopeptide (TPR) repeat protein